MNQAERRSLTREILLAAIIKSFWRSAMETDDWTYRNLTGRPQSFMALRLDLHPPSRRNSGKKSLEWFRFIAFPAKSNNAEMMRLSSTGAKAVLPPRHNANQ
jgi:hypothetical protein